MMGSITIAYGSLLGRQVCLPCYLLWGGETRTVILRRRLPVRLLYRTADAMADGTILFRDDINERDGPLLTALDQPFRPLFSLPRVDPDEPGRRPDQQRRVTPERAG